MGNRVAIVTGAGRGIGREAAVKLAQSGVDVVINYSRSEDAALETKRLCEEAGAKAILAKGDVSNEEECKAIVDLAISELGRLDILVNNAGITNDKLALRMKTSEFTDVINANLTSAFIGCREALKVMSKKRFGAVVNVASIVGEMGNAGQVNYSASKGGLIAMSKSFAKEGASRNIRFNSVTPGFIETDMTHGLSDEVKKTYSDNIPLKRFGSASEVAEAVAFLLSDHASYVTGETLKINGGLYM